MLSSHCLYLRADFQIVIIICHAYRKNTKWITGIKADSKNYKQIITVGLTAGSPYMQKKKHPDLRISSIDILAALTQTSYPTAFCLLGKADIPVVENSFLGQCVKGTSAALSL